MQEQVHIDVTGNILEVLKQVKAGFDSASKSTDNFQQTATDKLSKLEKSLKSVNLASFQQNLQSLNQGFQDLNAPGLGFNSNLKDLSALTKTTGKDLDALGESARASALEFGGKASDSLNTYKTILGRLGPDIAKDREALMGMEHDVQVLSKTMGNDAPGAVDALTTAALQFGVDLSQPKIAMQEMRMMMDVMANSAQEGAAEVPSISAALKVSGVAAKQAKVSFIETNAAIQALAQGGKEGSEAGMALRNVLGKMAGEDVIPKEAAEKLKRLGVNMEVVSNTSLPFTTRLRELKKAQGDATIMAQVFGVENAAAANILLSSADAQDELSKKIGKAGGAQAQANVVMESATEKMARMQAKIDDVKLSFFESTGGMTAYLGPLTQVGQTLTSFTPLFTMTKGGFTMMKGLITDSIPKVLGYAKGLGDVASGAKSASGAMSGMSSFLKAGPWVALAAGVAAVAWRISEVASGAIEAKRNMDEMLEGNKEGEKRGSRIVNFQKKKDDEKLRQLDNKQLAGEITQEQYNQERLRILENQSLALKGQVQTANLTKQAATEAYQKQLAIQKASGAKQIGAGIGVESTKAFFGIDNEASKTAQKKGNIYSVNKELTVLNEAKSEADKEIERLRAEIKGGKSKGTGTTPPLNLGTPSGYTPKATPEVRQGAGEVKSINVKIEQLIGELTIKTTNLSEGIGEAKKKISEALIGAVRDFEVAI